MYTNGAREIGFGQSVIIEPGLSPVWPNWSICAMLSLNGACLEFLGYIEVNLG